MVNILLNLLRHRQTCQYMCVSSPHSHRLTMVNTPHMRPNITLGIFWKTLGRQMRPRDPTVGRIFQVNRWTGTIRCLATPNVQLKFDNEIILDANLSSLQHGVFFRLCPSRSNLVLVTIHCVGEHIVVPHPVLVIDGSTEVGLEFRRVAIFSPDTDVV